MTLKYVDERSWRKQEWTDLESCVDSLLTPDASYDGGELERIREEIDHIRGCLSRYMVKKGLTMNDLDEIFYCDMKMVEDDNG